MIPSTRSFFGFWIDICAVIITINTSPILIRTILPIFSLIIQQFSRYASSFHSGKSVTKDCAFFVLSHSFISFFSAYVLDCTIYHPRHQHISTHFMTPGVSPKSKACISMKLAAIIKLRLIWQSSLSPSTCVWEALQLQARSTKFYNH